MREENSSPRINGGCGGGENSGTGAGFGGAGVTALASGGGGGGIGSMGAGFLTHVHDAMEMVPQTRRGIMRAKSLLSIRELQGSFGATWHLRATSLASRYY